jgi:hypothetical protein
VYLKREIKALTKNIFNDNNNTYLDVKCHLGNIYVKLEVFFSAEFEKWRETTHDHACSQKVRKNRFLIAAD